MTIFSEGDRVRIDIPDERDPDHEEYHGRHGTVQHTFTDDAGTVTGDEADQQLITVELDDGEHMEFRARDLRPPFEG